MSTSYPQKVAVRFGGFELDHSGELRSKGRKIKLQDQPLQILQFLIERHGQIVTREELRARIWPSDTFVDFDHGINNAIKRLREALRNTANSLPRGIASGESLARSEQEFFADGLSLDLSSAINRQPRRGRVSLSVGFQLAG